MPTPSESPRPRVVIAGGGIAGIEAALALQALAPGLVDVLVIDPGEHFSIPSTAMGRAFGIGARGDVPLAEIVARAGAELRRARLVAVDAERHEAMLAGGELVRFDHLLVATGARREPYLSEALAFRGHEDADAVLPLVDELAAISSPDARRTLAIVVPPGVLTAMLSMRAQPVSMRPRPLHEMSSSKGSCGVLFR
jgi:sulfide:quinone oxidoreductase